MAPQVQSLMTVLSDIQLSNAAQLNTHAVALERCRVAVEWQLALNEAGVVHFQQTERALRGANAAATELLCNPEVNDLARVSEHWRSITTDTQELLELTDPYRALNEQLQTCLSELASKVCELENLSSVLAAMNQRVHSLQTHLSLAKGGSLG